MEIVPVQMYVQLFFVERPTQLLTRILGHFLSRGGYWSSHRYSSTLNDNRITLEISPTEVRRTLHDKLSPASRLKHVDIYGKLLHLVNGEWVEAPSSMA
jgi:hypothetical protein